MPAFTLGKHSEIHPSDLLFYGALLRWRRESGLHPEVLGKDAAEQLGAPTNDRYYARLYLNGKEKWQSLKTSHFSVAEAKLAALQKEHREQRDKAPISGDAKMAFGQAAALHMQRRGERVATPGRLDRPGSTAGMAFRSS